MAEINPILNLNKHPKECDNLSFVGAINVKIDNDKSCITNENSIEINDVIREATKNFDKIEIIPCNTELVIFAILDNKIDLYRYNEKKDEIKIVCRGIDYHYGKIKGAFTYNVNNELIISFSEYDCIGGDLIPLRTINLDTIDIDINNNLLPNSPEVIIPSFDNYDYTYGNAYKGWNYIFIRYKIDKVDYTQWYSIGYPIYIDTIENKQITKYCFSSFKHNDTDVADINDNSYYGFIGGFDKDGNGTGFSDYISNDLDFANETFKIIINNLDNNFDKYQIGIICVSKTYNKCFRTYDIDINNAEYIFNIKNVIEYSTSELIIDNYNYFNVGNIINYQNRLYISNYNETNLNNHNNYIKECANNVTLKLINKDKYHYDDFIYDSAIVKNINSNSLQFDTIYQNMISFDKYLSINPFDRVDIIVDGVNITEGYYYSFAKNFYFSKAENNEFGVSIYYINSIIVSYLDGDIKIVTKNNTIDFRMNTSYFSEGGCYINTNKNFNTRKKESTLIPGEIYNFFIHYVDKYGHATNGYRIDNHVVWKAENNSFNIVPVKFLDRNNNIVYAAINENYNVLLEEDINITDIAFYRSINYINLNPTLSDEITNNISDLIEDFIEYFKYFRNDKFNGYKWYQITDAIGLEFNTYINNNNERLFRVPLDYNKLFNIKVTNVTIPEGYVGYYISYEKFEGLKITSGLLTRADATSQDFSNEFVHTTYAKNLKNTQLSNNMLFYSNYFDISDSIKLNFDIMRIDIKNPFYINDLRFFNNVLRNGAYTFMHDLNKPQINFSYSKSKTYPMPNFTLGIANDGTNNRGGVGTALIIDNSYELFESYTTSETNNGRINLYLVTLLNCTRNIYMDSNKTLIKLSNVIYSDDDYIIDNGFNGHYTYNSTIVYSMDGIKFNNATNRIKRLNDNTDFISYIDTSHGHDYINYPFAEYIQYLDCSDVFYESRSFKNKPQTIVYYLNGVDEESDKIIIKDGSENKFWVGSIVLPINSIDLFQNKQASIDELVPKTYSNYKDNINYLERFDKTVRRSNIIQDESRNNAWRTFVTDSYKMINENKGNITNIIGIGYMFLIHTEHSLFLLDVNNILKTKEKDVYLGLTDVFDTDYKELLTSELGYGGMQDNESWILGQFGYIFYDNDSNRFYRYDDQKLNVIDESIINWLYKYKPINVRFVNDFDNNRLLIKANYGTGKSITFSYNYITGQFVSNHSYTFDKGYNTKNKLYLRNNNKIYQFNDNTYGIIPEEILLNNLDNKTEFSIIVNVGYEFIKFLEFISYKLTKINVNVDTDYTYSPVEKSLIPFSGDILQVYNNNVDTKELDINIESEEAKNTFSDYTKPYWHLGNWNFSYLRDKAADWVYGKAVGMSRVYGNYFIIRFVFNNEDNNKIEFENIDYKITQNNI